MSRVNDPGIDVDAQQARVEPFHVPFSWLHGHGHDFQAGFIETVADMCAGVQTCLQLIHSTDLALHARSMGDDEAIPVLSTNDRERLLRLATAVSGTLADAAHEHIESINEKARKARQGGAG